MRHNLQHPTKQTMILGAVLCAAVLLAGGRPVGAQRGASHDGMSEQVAKLQDMAPARGYLEAHRDVDHPLEILGGPIRVQVKQSEGGVFVALPDNRELDPRVFGTPDHPRAFAGSPGMEGVPVPLRGEANGGFTSFEAKSPFGDAHTAMADGRLTLTAVDATATDAATTKDSVKLDASWKDEAGNTYEVRCCDKLAAHGLEYPTFGGVVTNHMLHGFTRLGTPLMPSEFAYVAFWGMGEVLENGKVVARPRLIHGMLTEYVRTTSYRLASDDEVTPEKLHFHLMVPPAKPDPAKGVFEPSPVHTGFKLPNGQELPFWHVMFSNLDIHAERTGT